MTAPKYLLDVGTCLSLLGHDSAGTLGRLKEAVVGEVAVSSITQSELMFCAAMSTVRDLDQALLGLFLEHVTVLDYPAGAGRDYGEIRERLTLREEMLGATEVLLAAQARWLGLTLVTKRGRGFGRVPGLGVESWG